jgi:hypothetical protein
MKAIETLVFPTEVHGLTGGIGVCEALSRAIERLRQGSSGIRDTGGWEHDQ